MKAMAGLHGGELVGGELVCDSSVDILWKVGNPGATGLLHLQTGGRPVLCASIFGCQRNDCRQIHTLYDLGPVRILHLYFFVFIIFLFF